MNRLSTFRASRLIAGLALAATALSTNAQPQTATQAGERDGSASASVVGLNLPENVTLLDTNPNVRQPTAKVNGAIITGTDVSQRVALVAAGREVSDEEMLRLRGQVLRNLIDEVLQIQEAQAQEIQVTAEEVAQTYTRVAAENFGSNVSELDSYLRSIGSSPASLQRQIEGQMAWDRLQRRNIRPFVNVSAEEVNTIIERLQESRGTEEYRIGEIYLSATPATSDAVMQNGRAIIEQLRQGGSFQAYAVQYSEASTAPVGGDLGWVRLEQLPAELATTARELQPGQVAGPIALPGGFSILLLIDKRQILTADPRDAMLSLKQITMGFPEGVTQPQATAMLERFRDGVSRMRGCGDSDAIAAEIGAEVVANDQVQARSLPPALQGAILQLQVGQATQPFGSVDEGVRVLMLCGRDDPQVAAGPNFDTIMNQMEDDRINQRAQRYLRDLRRDAVIDYN